MPFMAPSKDFVQGDGLRPGACRADFSDHGVDIFDARKAAELGDRLLAADLTTTNDPLRNPDQLRRSFVALPAPQGVNPPRL